MNLAGSDDLLERMLAGETRALARMMSYAESSRPEHRAYLANIYGHAGKARLIGLTGVPGSGKSTLVRAMTLAMRARGQSVGIVAVDPSSSFTGGAILGDRVRMAELAKDQGVFIRSMATRGALGGLTRAVFDTTDLLDAAGFDVVLIETVGVGQDEVDIANAAHTVVVVSAPGLGDGIQAIKAGVLEIADINVVSKCDRQDASKTVSDLRAMLEFGLTGRGLSEWDVPVISTSGETGEGINQLVDAIDEHGEHLESSGELVNRQREIIEMRVLKIVEEIMRDRIEGRRYSELGPLIDLVVNRKLDPRTAAQKLIKNLNINL